MTNTSVLQGLANNCRLQYVNEPEPAAFGVFDNFGIVVKYLASERQYIILVSAAATSDEAVNGMISSLSQFAGERKKTINYTSFVMWARIQFLHCRRLSEQLLIFVISLDLFQYVSIVEIKWI